MKLGRTEEYDYDPPEPGSYELPVIRKAADGRVLGPEGEPARLRALMDGRITILSFVYTRGADPRACPMTSGVLHQVHRWSEGDPVTAENLRLITMSFDPDYDTPDRMAAYGRHYDPKRGGAEWLFLTTRGEEELALDMVEQIGVPCEVVVNRAGSDGSRMEEFCRRRGVEIVAELPDDRRVADIDERRWIDRRGLRRRRCPAGLDATELDVRDLGHDSAMQPGCTP